MNRRVIGPTTITFVDGRFDLELRGPRGTESGSVSAARAKELGLPESLDDWNATDVCDAINASNGVPTTLWVRVTGSSPCSSCGAFVGENHLLSCPRKSKN